MVDNAPDITLDNVLNTGENTDRQTVETSTDDNLTPEEIAAKEASDAKEGKEDDKKDDLTPEEVAANQAENNNNLKNLFSSFVDDASLSEDDKAIRTQLLDKHKGTSFDAEGNILDKDGNILTAFDKLLEYSLEEDKFTIDDKGNQVDAEGKIVKTAVEVAVDTTVVNKLHSESDYEFQNEDGSTKIYSDDEAGIKDFTNDVSSQRFEEWKSEFFSQTPELAEVTKHLLSGGSIDTYNSAVDYSKLDVSTMSKDEKIKHIRRSFEVTGLGEERINGLLQLFTDSNTIDAEITKALPALQEHEQSQTQQRDDAYLQSVDERNQKVETYWNDVSSTVEKGTLADITIPKEEQENFFNYLSAVVDDKGNSKEMLDSGKETLEQQLQIKYLRFKGYDLNKLVETKVKSQKVTTLKDLIKRSAKLKTTPISNSRQKQTSGESNVTIDSLLS